MIRIDYVTIKAIHQVATALSITFDYIVSVAITKNSAGFFG